MSLILFWSIASLSLLYMMYSCKFIILPLSILNSLNFYIFYKQVVERLGISNKKNYNRLATMWSRFGLSVQPEMQKKAMAYRLRTSEEHNSGLANAFHNKSENANENKTADLCVGSPNALDRSGRNQTHSAYDCSTLKGDTASPGNVEHRDINTEPSNGYPRFSESNQILLSPENPQLKFLEPRDTTDSLLSTAMEINVTSAETLPVVLKPLGSGSDPRYPCLSLSEDSTRREKRILQRLQVLFIIRYLKGFLLVLFFIYLLYIDS